MLKMIKINWNCAHIVVGRTEFVLLEIVKKDVLKIFWVFFSGEIIFHNLQPKNGRFAVDILPHCYGKNLHTLQGTPGEHQGPKTATNSNLGLHSTCTF